MFDQSFLLTLPHAVRLSDGTVDRNDTRLRLQWNGAICKTVLKNIGSKQLRIREVALFYGRFPIAADCPFHSEGYHMLTQHAGTLAEPHVIGKYGHDEDFFSLEKSPFAPDTYTSYNYLLLSPTQVDRILMGFTSCFRFQSEFRFKDNYIEIVLDCENLALQPDETWRLEEFCVLTGDRAAVFARFADLILQNHPRRRYPFMPNGWCSYHSISGIKAEEMYHQARVMKARIPDNAGFQPMDLPIRISATHSLHIANIGRIHADQIIISRIIFSF